MSDDLFWRLVAYSVGVLVGYLVRGHLGNTGSRWQ